MNSQRSHFGTTRTYNPNTRAQFSPLLRRATQGAFARSGAAARLPGKSSSGTSIIDDPHAPSSLTTSDRGWARHLIDRLHSPLTRYHD